MRSTQLRVRLVHARRARPARRERQAAPAPPAPTPRVRAGACAAARPVSPRRSFMRSSPLDDPGRCFLPVMPRGAAGAWRGSARCGSRSSRTGSRAPRRSSGSSRRGRRSGRAPPGTRPGSSASASRTANASSSSLDRRRRCRPARPSDGSSRLPAASRSRQTRRVSCAIHGRSASGFAQRSEPVVDPHEDVLEGVLGVVRLARR